MTDRLRIWVERAAGRIALACWGEAGSGKPPALLVHGTGFVAEIWDEVAGALASSHTVYALDRRGHGASHKPATGQYHFVMEPTVMDPRAARSDGAQLSDKGMSFVQGVLRRQVEFESAAAAFRRFRAAPAFADWSEPALWTYVQHGFEVLQDGRVRLLCTPQMESAVLLPIFEAMEQVYAGDQRGNPFRWLSEIDCPVRVATAERSWPVYKAMAARAVALIPVVSQWTFDGVGHCVAQERPALLLGALEAFKAGAG
jgi:pimeloyl-ACP methyl ester carboxylesterase